MSVLSNEIDVIIAIILSMFLSQELFGDYDDVLGTLLSFQLVLVRTCMSSACSLGILLLSRREIQVQSQIRSLFSFF